MGYTEHVPASSFLLFKYVRKLIKCASKCNYDKRCKPPNEDVNNVGVRKVQKMASQMSYEEGNAFNLKDAHGALNINITFLCLHEISAKHL